MATRFVTTHKSNNAAINDLSDRAEKNTVAVVTNTTTTGITMTTAQMLAGVFVTTAAGAFALTLPTAVDMIAALPNAQVGTQFVCFLVNAGNNTLTITTNTGNTITGGHGTATMATATSQILVGKVTAATTITYFPILKTAS
jgi:hypothetical protein